MKTLLVCYDLKNANEEQYQRVKSAIKSLGVAEHTQYSVWVLQTTKTDVQVRDHLRLFIKPNDSLLVCGINSFASYDVPINATNLISRSLQSPRLEINKLKSPLLQTKIINPLHLKF
jgi:CRISPR-associated endonuclease Cas2